MKTRKIKGVLFDPKTHEFRNDDFLFSFNKFYTLLGCSCCEYVRATFGSADCMIVCDEDGKLKERQITSIKIFGEDGSLVDTIVGNVLIFGVSSEGDLASLTTEQTREIDDSFCYGRLTCHLPKRRV